MVGRRESVCFDGCDVTSCSSSLEKVATSINGASVGDTLATLPYVVRIQRMPPGQGEAPVLRPRLPFMRIVPVAPAHPL